MDDWLPYRMGGVPNQDDTSLDPSRVGLVHEERPTFDMLGQSERQQ